MYSTMEKKSLVSNKTAPVSKSNSIRSRRVDLSKPAPVRVLSCACSGKHIKNVIIMM